MYLDFFGLVMWDLIPTNPDEIRQIEVIRGPASAVWGANAMNGVVNVITKSPRELAAEGGTKLTLGMGDFGRNVPGRSASRGSLFYATASHAEAVNDRWSYKISAGFYGQDALARPSGTIFQCFSHAVPAVPELWHCATQIRRACRPRLLRRGQTVPVWRGLLPPKASSTAASGRST